MQCHEDCPDCLSGLTRVLESTLCHNGTRRRRYRCLACDHRWTQWNGPRPPAGRHGKPRSTAKRGKPVTSDEVRQILLTPRSVSHSELARQIGVSRELVRLVRLGRLHPKRHPDLPRWPDPRRGLDGQTCHNCAHWSAGCDYGFPEAVEEGPLFALECDLYAAA